MCMCLSWCMHLQNLASLNSRVGRCGAWTKSLSSPFTREQSCRTVLRGKATQLPHALLLCCLSPLLFVCLFVCLFVVFLGTGEGWVGEVACWHGPRAETLRKNCVASPRGLGEADGQAGFAEYLTTLRSTELNPEVLLFRGNDSRGFESTLGKELLSFTKLKPGIAELLRAIILFPLSQGC